MPLLYVQVRCADYISQQDAFLHVYDDPEPMRNSPYIELSGKAAQWDWYHQVKSRSEAVGRAAG